MLANITESANFVVRATTDDDRKSQLLKQLVRTLLGQFAHMRRAQPGLAKDVLHFKVVEVLVVVTSRRHLWQRRQILRVCRSEEHTSELQSLMRISYAVFCLK